MAEFPFVPPSHGEDGGRHQEAQARLRRMMDEHRRSMEGVEAYGLVDSMVGPGFVSAYSSSGTAQQLEISIMYGQPTSPTGPLVVVTTGSILRRFDVESVTSRLDDQLDDEHDRVRDHAGVHEPCDPTKARPARMTIAGAVLEGHIMDDGPLWAFLASLPGDEEHSAWICVVSRGVPAEQVALEHIDDLSGFWKRREEWIGRMVAASGTRTHPRDPEPTRGLDAYRDLVAASIADAEPLMAAAREGRSVRRTARTRRQEWDAAVDVQLRLCDQTRSQAYEAVSSLVTHMVNLSNEVAWTSDAHAWAAAVEESIGHVVFDAPVASRSAQRAWAEHRSASRFPSVAESVDRLDGGGAHAAHVLQLRQTWVDAWNAWYRSRPS